MSNWNYSASNYDPTAPIFELVPEGNKRLEILEAYKALTKSGKDMLVVRFAVVGAKGKINWYCVNTERFQASFDKFIESFGISPEDAEYALTHNEFDDWRGLRGAAKIKHDLNDRGQKNHAIESFIERAKHTKDEPKKVETRHKRVPEDDIPMPTDTITDEDTADVPF